MKNLKTKNNTGITLVALIITIVVLLILAVVSIGAVQNSDIIGKAQSASTKHKEGTDNETIRLSQYENFIKEQTKGKWELKSDGKTITNGETEVVLGDEIENEVVLEATGGTQKNYTGTWTVLGVENGKLKLVSTKNVTTSNVTLGNLYEGVVLEEYNVSIEERYKKAIWSWKNAVNILNSHAQNETGITSARSLTLEDLEVKEVFNITDNDKLALSENKYGNSFTYAYSEGKTGVFVEKDGNVIGVNAKNQVSASVEHNYYEVKESLGDTYLNKALNDNSMFWLASPCAICYDDKVEYKVQYVLFGKVYAGNLLFASNYSHGSAHFGIRAVVYI